MTNTQVTIGETVMHTNAKRQVNRQDQALGMYQ